jgi:stringent starvation protein B
VKPRRPYLLRALHEWITDSGDTPHIVVDASDESVMVPRQYVKDGKIVLNVSYSAAQGLKMGNDFVNFDARFNGASFSVSVPIKAVLGIYSRETGQGMIFPEGDADPDPDDQSPSPTPPPAASASDTAAKDKRSRFKVVK